MPYTTRELLARLIKCEAGGEGDDGMAAVASVVRNRADVPYGEFFRVSQGGDIRKIIEQPGQFVLRCYVGTKLYINENPTKLIHKQHEADAPLFTRRVVGFFLCSYPIRRLPLRSYIRT